LADLTALLNALGLAFATGWEILWPLVLGFALSAVIQAVVSHREMSRLLPDDSPRSISAGSWGHFLVLLLRGRVAFILADLIVLPILSIYRAALRISDGANSRREQPRLDDYPNL
jgi:hypothetical protein